MDLENLLNPISTIELERRWAAVRAEMRRHGVDVLIMQSASDHMGGYVRWFTDIPATNGYPRAILFFRDEPMVVVEQGGFNGTQILDGKHGVHRGVGQRLFAPAYCSVHYTGHYDADRAVDELKRHAIKKVGIVNSASMYHDFGNIVLSYAREHYGIINFTDEIDNIKSVKSVEEIEFIRRTANIQDDIFSALLDKIHPGMRDLEVTALAQYLGHCMESEQGTFNGASAKLGRPSMINLHRHEQARRIQAGDHLNLLIENNGPGGLYTEIARTIVFGKASAELKDTYDLMKQAQKHTVSLLKPGVTFADVAREHDAFMASHGYPAEIRLYAHGQGYDMVERPLVRFDESMSVRAGMNLAVHPSHASKTLFVTACDNFLTRNDGLAECLHATPQVIFEL